MATVRLDFRTEATLRHLSKLRGQTQSEVIRDAIARLNDEEGEQLSAYQRMQAFIGIFDSGGKQLSKGTRKLRELFEQDRKRARSPE